MTGKGFPHSDIFGSQLTYSSPKRFAVRRVLHRLLVPRHPPCALLHLTTDGVLTLGFFAKPGVCLQACVLQFSRYEFEQLPAQN